MYCPFCSEETKVLESRIIDNSVRRRRECLDCRNRFTTYETAVFKFTVIKKDGREEPFASEKIRNSLQKACSRMEESCLAELAKKIERKILLKKLNPIKTTEIGRIVLGELRKVDKIAYLRFATIHKEIDDPKLLKREIKMIA